MDIDVIKAQYDAVIGCAAGLEQIIESAGEALRPGLEVAVMALKRTAQGMLLEAMLYVE